MNMKKRYCGGEKVPQGFYWNRATGEFFQSSAPGTVLPGGSDKQYIRVPAPLVLMVGPLLGLGYVIFLPLVGIVVLLAFVMRQLARLVRRLLQRAAQVMVPTWVPGVSYLLRGRRGKKKPQPKAADQLLGEMEQGLQERRLRGEK